MRYALACGRHTRQIRSTGNQNGFRHGLAGISQRRNNGALNSTEHSIRSTAMRVLAEIIASDVSLLVTFNQATDGVMQNNQKARQNPKALAQLDGYKSPLVGSLSANPQRFGMDRLAKIKLYKSTLRLTVDGQVLIVGFC